MELNKNTLEKVLELVKELPASSRVSALVALGISGTLIAVGHTVAGMWKVYQEVSVHRWFWEDYVIIGLAKLRELGMWENLAGMNPALGMLSAGALRHQKRSGWYSNKLPMNPNLTLTQPAKIEGAPPLIYVTLGDSIAQGVGCKGVRDPYVALLALYLRRAARRWVIVLNLSISGVIPSTVTGTELPRLLTLGVKPDPITLDVGGNDTSADDAEIPAELFEKNLEIICRYLLVPTLTAEVPAVTSPPRDRRTVELNEALKVAVEGSPHIVAPIRKLGEVPLWRILSIRTEDGFHPNVDGYRGAALGFARASETLPKECDLWQDTVDDLYSQATKI